MNSKMNKTLVAFFAVLCLVGLGAFASAQEDMSEEWSSGTIEKVTDKTVTLSEYDYETEKHQSVTYHIPPKLTWEEGKGKANLVKDAYVDVYYMIKDGKKVLTAVEFSSDEGEEEWMEDMDDHDSSNQE